MRQSSQYTLRGFHILSDAQGHFKPLDALCQFEYKHHQISMSTGGLSQGACQTEVSIFAGPNRQTEIKRTNTVEEAIEYIDNIDSLSN